MSDYILVVSTPKPPAWISAEALDPQQQAAQEHIVALKQMETNLPTLHRESIPDFDTSLDVARCLAGIASTVARSSASINIASEPSARPSATRARDRDVEARIDAVVSACYDVEHHAARTIERVEARSEGQARPRSLSSSTSSLLPQFQSFALSPSAALAPPRHPFASLHFTSPNFANLGIRRGSRDQGTPGSPVAPEGERPLSTMLEAPVNPLEPYQRSNAIPPGVPSFPSSSSPELPPESPTMDGKQRRKSIPKSPSRGELNRSATRKRSGFLRMLSARRDE
jgi:hypothetical protein